MERNGLLEIIAVHRTGKDLNEVVRKDKDYQDALVQQKEVFAMLEEVNLTAAQKRVVDKAIEASNHTGAIYGAVAYRFGMMDGINIVRELKEHP